MSTTTMKKGLAGLKKEMAKNRKNKFAGEKNEMIFLDTKSHADKLTVDTLSDYINIASTTLNKNANVKLPLVFGPVISIQRAIDYVMKPKMLVEQLMVPKLSKVALAHIGRQTRTLVNFWALNAYFIVERVTQDAELRKILMEDKVIINVDIEETNTFKGPIKVFTPIVTDAMYLGIVREVVKVLRTTDKGDEADAFMAVINSVKKDKSLSIFAGTDIKTDNL